MTAPGAPTPSADSAEAGSVVVAGTGTAADPPAETSTDPSVETGFDPFAETAFRPFVGGGPGGDLDAGAFLTSHYLNALNHRSPSSNPHRSPLRHRYGNKLPRSRPIHP